MSCHIKNSSPVCQARPVKTAHAHSATYRVNTEVCLCMCERERIKEKCVTVRGYKYDDTGDL